MEAITDVPVLRFFEKKGAELIRYDLPHLTTEMIQGITTSSLTFLWKMSFQKYVCSISITVEEPFGSSCTHRRGCKEL